ncbi:MAG: hypothetical protein JWO36_739 [Myxococcales bacterium]|nr:hypothetical protein [Myxococcales bacterium]
MHQNRKDTSRERQTEGEGAEPSTIELDRPKRMRGSALDGARSIVGQVVEDEINV